MNEIEKKKIKIFGAGFSGLSLACELIDRGRDVEIYEKSDRIGGLIQSVPISSNIYIERAANGLRGTKVVQSFLQRFQVGYVPSQKISQKRFIYRHHRFNQWPLSFIESVSFVSRLFYHLVLKKLKPLNLSESIYSYSQRIIGKTATDYLTAAVFSGVYATKSQSLNVYLVLKIFFSNIQFIKNNFYLAKKINKKQIYTEKSTQKQFKKMPLLSGQKGTEDIVQGLYQFLMNKNVKFHFNIQNSHELIAAQLKNKEIVVIATKAHEALEVVQKLSLNDQCELVRQDITQALTFLPQVQMISLLSINVISTKLVDKAKQGFGVLFPDVEKVISGKFNIMGLLFNDLVFDRHFTNEQNEPRYTEKWILKPNLNSRQVMSEKEFELNKNDLICEFKKRRYEVLNLSEETIEHLDIQFWEKGLPLYSSDHLSAVLKLKEQNRLFLHGNYFSDIGLSNIIEFSQKQADLIEIQSQSI